MVTAPTSSFMLALLKPPAPTASVEVLVEVGLSYEKVRDRIVDLSSGVDLGDESVSQG